MALRIKCKCGKSMKVSSALADKKLLCPGCKRAFRIPAEKFKRAAATPVPAPAPGPSASAKVSAAPSKPPAETPMPAPVELDLLPANLDWSGDLAVSRSDIFAGLIPDQKEAPVPGSSTHVGLTCPLCKRQYPPQVKICINCGFDLHTRTYLKTSLPPNAAAASAAAAAISAAPASAVSYGADRARPAASGSGRPDKDVIQRPKGSFWADASAAFGYPFRNTENGVTFFVIAVVVSLQVVLGWLSEAMGSFGTVVMSRLAPILCFIIRGWVYAVYLSVVRDTATGSADLPNLKMEDGFVEDVAKPFFKYLGAFACAFAPAAVYVILGVTDLLPKALSSDATLLVLIAAGTFFWPMLVALFAFEAFDMLVRIDRILATIFRTFLPYVCLWAMLLLVGFTSVVPLAIRLAAAGGFNIALPNLMTAAGSLGALAGMLIDLYLSLVAMRLIGLYYLHYKKRFALVME
jgi:hypothetical protein